MFWKQEIARSSRAYPIMYTAEYFPYTLGPSKTMHGFASIEDAWKAICPGCDGNIYFEDGGKHGCACRSEWTVLKTEDYYKQIIDDYRFYREEVRSTYAALPDEVKATLPDVLNES